MKKILPIACVLCLFGFGCGGDDEGVEGEGGPGPGDVSCDGGELDLSGQWSGTWVSRTASGTWDVDWQQDASGALNGTIAVTGTVCGTGGPITGTVNGCSVSFGLVDTSMCEVDYAGTVDGDTMSGTLEATAKQYAGLKDSGTWEGHRVQ